MSAPLVLVVRQEAPEREQCMPIWPAPAPDSEPLGAGLAAYLYCVEKPRRVACRPIFPSSHLSLLVDFPRRTNKVYVPSIHDNIFLNHLI